MTAFCFLKICFLYYDSRIEISKFNMKITEFASVGDVVTITFYLS